MVNYNLFSVCDVSGTILETGNTAGSNIKSLLSLNLHFSRGGGEERETGRGQGRQRRMGNRKGGGTEGVEKGERGNKQINSIA